eukprot:g8066.t1
MAGTEDADTPPAAAAVQNMRRANKMGLLWSVPRAGAMIIVGAVSQQQHEHCDKPLFAWVVVLIAHDLVRMPIRQHILRRLDALGRIDEAQSGTLESGLKDLRASFVCRFGKWLTHAAHVWYTVGAVWICGAAPCAESSPHLYKLALALLVIAAAFIAMNVLCG